MLEKTLCIIKPDGVEQGLVGEVIRRLEKEGFRLMAVKMIHLTQEKAERFYLEHKGRDFYHGLIAFMISGPSVVAVFEGENIISQYREIMGATDPDKAEEGTIRKDFATDGRRNVVHGSDSVDSAQSEIAFFFNDSELF